MDKVTIQFTKKEIKEFIDDFANLAPEQARIKYKLDLDKSLNKKWTVKGSQEDLKRTGLSKNNIQAINFKPFDIRYTYYTGQLKDFSGSLEVNL
jgi:regulator of replication initiation timing